MGGFVPTLNTGRFSIAGLGNLATQPANNATAANLKHESNQSNSTTTRGVVSAAEAAIKNLVGLTLVEGQLQRIIQPTLSTLVHEVTSNENFILPILTSQFNKIIPSYFSHLKPRIVHRPEASDDFSVTTRKFEPYEQRTGISHERPEIVMMMPFLPLFNRDIGHSKPEFLEHIESTGINPYMTTAGWYCDTQLHSRNLRAANLVQDLRKLKKNSSLKKTYNKRKNEFEKNLKALHDATLFLLNLVQRAEILKQKLDLRDDSYVVKPDTIAHRLGLEFPWARSESTTQLLQQYVKKFLPPSYTIPDLLIKLGYPRDNARSLYSSSKLWLQLMLEYKDILQTHSLAFLDIEHHAQKSDKNASTLTRPDGYRFDLVIPDQKGIQSVGALALVKPNEVQHLINDTSVAFNSIYVKGAHFKSEEARIAALANLLSKQFKYSKALDDKVTRRFLSEYYGYTVQGSSQGNLPVFDNVVGQFGHNISDFPRTQTKSFAAVAQQQPAANVAVLTFETKYLDGDTGTLTPGASFYVDPVFDTDGKNLETKSLDPLNVLMKNNLHALGTVVNTMNLLSIIDSDKQSRNKKNISSYIANPADLIDYILSSFLDKNGNTLAVIKNDRLVSVFALAASHVELRSILFQFTVNKMRGFNTATADKMISRLLAILEASTKETKAHTVNTDANDVDDESIKKALKHSTHLLDTVKNLLNQLYLALQDEAVQDDRVRYSGQYNTIILMVAFDMIIAMLGKYANQRIVSRKTGSRSGNRKVTYQVTKANGNHKNSHNDISTRLNRELALTHEITYALFNTLQRLGDTVEGFLNFIKSPTSSAQLRAISKIIDDKTLLQLLMSEQQIMLLGSTVYDLLEKFNQSMTSDPYVDIDRDGDFDSDDEIKLLDDSVISPKLRNAFFGIFNTPMFVGTRAANKRILTVGVPLGFTSRLKQKVNQEKLKKTSFVNKENDIVQVVVYKIDLLNQDVIFKPQRFLFEMSRFPVRNDTYYKKVSDNPSFDEIASAIPTRDWQESYKDGSRSIAYWNSNQANATDTRNALDADDYSFLSKEQKAEIIKNHLISYMSEVYIKLVAGMNVGDYTFDLIDRPKAAEPEFIKLLVDHKVQGLVDFTKFNTQPVPKLTSQSPTLSTLSSISERMPTGGVLFSTTLRQALPSVGSLFKHETQVQPRTSNASGIAAHIDVSQGYQTIENPPNPVPLKTQIKPITNMAAALDNISSRYVPTLVHSLKSLSNFAKIQTTLSDGLAVSRQLLSPKQFDRVFNVIIDPDEFDIDFARSTSTVYGTRALRLMLQRGEIIPSAVSKTGKEIKLNLPLRNQLTRVLSHPAYKGHLDPNINNFHFRERDRNNRDMLFEKYFVTVETIEENDDI